ncbi:MAG: hypothetical protein WDO73_18335 [Ignavibacteriota bacterium]
MSELNCWSICTSLSAICFPSCFWRLPERLAGALVAYVTHPLYRARVTLDIQQFDENILNMRSNSEPSNNSSAPAESYIQTEMKILESEAMARRVIEKLGAAPAATPAPPPTSDIAAWSRTFPLAAPGITDRHASLEAIGKSLKARTLGLTRIVEVLCDARDPGLAADFCNSLANEYIAQNSETRWQTAQQTEQWLSHQLADTKQRLAKSEEELQRAAKDLPVALSENDGLSQDKLRQLQSELTAAEADRMRKQSQYELASTQDSVVFASDGPAREYEVKLTDLRRQLAQLSTTMTPAHYKVQEVESQIKVLQSSLDQERASTVRRMWSDYQSALRRQDLLKDNYTSMLSSLTGEAPKIVEYNLLKAKWNRGVSCIRRCSTASRNWEWRRRCAPAPSGWWIARWRRCDLSLPTGNRTACSGLSAECSWDWRWHA